MRSFKRVAILGAAGQLGSELVKAFDSDYETIAWNHALVDLEDPASMLHALERYRPDLVVNTAAFHQVDACEANPTKAFRVNALGVDLLAGMCALRGIPFGHVSTDYVFAGTTRTPYTEDDIPSPVNVYGVSKLAGEQLLARRGGEWFVFRTSGLFGAAEARGKGLTFVERMIRGAQSGLDLRVVDDITFSPSYAPHVAHAIRRIVEKGAPGVYHTSNSGSCTWHDLATHAIGLAGIKADVARTKSNLSGLPRRPQYSALAHAALLRQGLEDIPDWREGVAEYVRART